MLQHVINKITSRNKDKQQCFGVKKIHEHLLEYAYITLIVFIFSNYAINLHW